MAQGEPARVVTEVLEHTPSAVGDPEEIELEGNQLGVGLVQENVERSGVIDGLELELVVVIAEAEAGVLTREAQLVHLGGQRAIPLQ